MYRQNLTFVDLTELSGGEYPGFDWDAPSLTDAVLGNRGTS